MRFRDFSSVDDSEPSETTLGGKSQEMTLSIASVRGVQGGTKAGRAKYLMWRIKASGIVKTSWKQTSHP